MFNEIVVNLYTQKIWFKAFVISINIVKTTKTIIFIVWVYSAVFLSKNI
jgi:hypothetical protein